MQRATCGKRNLRTRSGLPRYCSWDVNSEAKRYVRCRYRGIDVHLTGVPWSSSFMEQYRSVLDGQRPDRIKDASPPVIVGGFNSLVLRYFQSVAFLDVGASTQINRRRILTNFCKEYGTLPVRGMTRKHVVSIVESRAATPMAANNLLKVLRYAAGGEPEQIW